MGHAKIAQAPGDGRDNMQQVIGLAAAGVCHIGGDQAEVAGQRLGVFHDGVHATGGDRRKNQHEQQRDRHDDALDEVRHRSGQEAACCGVGDDNDRGDDHRRHIICAE